MDALQVLFWLFAGLAVFPYIVYPAILWCLTRTRSVASDGLTESPPGVTVIISARNEEAVIEHKIRSTLNLDYPHDKLRIILVSDASTDGTNEIVNALREEDERVRLIAIEQRLGKTSGLNRAMATVESEIAIFTDANAIFDDGAIRELVKPFTDPKVGYVVGSALYRVGQGSDAGESEGLYWRYELGIKKLESLFHSVVGGDGAIYAVRSKLSTPLAAEDINDFVNPLQVIGKGYRGLFSATARAYEDPANDFDKEFSRKRRIVCRSWGALLRHGKRSGITQNARFMFMLISHKVIRWYTVAWIALACTVNIFILTAGGPGIYVLTAGLALVSMVLAFFGRRAARDERKVPSYFSIPYYFYSSNIAALLGIIDYARGNRYVTWDHVRTES